MIELAEFLEARIAEELAITMACIARRPVYGVEPDAYSELVDLAEHEGAAEEAVALAQRFHPDRVLAELDAKRRIVEWHVKTGRERFDWDLECCEEHWGPIELLAPDVQTVSVGTTGAGELSVRESFATQTYLGCTTLQLLALPYSGHPDFVQAWMPA